MFLINSNWTPCHLSESSLPHQPTSIIGNIHSQADMDVLSEDSQEACFFSFSRVANANWTIQLGNIPGSGSFLAVRPVSQKSLDKMQICWQIKEFVSHQPIRPSVHPSAALPVLSAASHSAAANVLHFEGPSLARTQALITFNNLSDSLYQRPLQEE